MSTAAADVHDCQERRSENERGHCGMPWRPVGRMLTDLTRGSVESRPDRHDRIDRVIEGCTKLAADGIHGVVAGCMAPVAPNDRKHTEARVHEMLLLQVMRLKSRAQAGAGSEIKRPR